MLYLSATPTPQVKTNMYTENTDASHNYTYIYMHLYELQHHPRSITRRDKRTTSEALRTGPQQLVIFVIVVMM